MKVFSQILGQSQAQSYDLEGDEDGNVSILDLREELGLEAHYAAKVNGIDANDATLLKDYAVVVWSEKVKGATKFTPVVYAEEIYC